MPQDIFHTLKDSIPKCGASCVTVCDCPIPLLLGCCFVLPEENKGNLPEPEIDWISRCTPVVGCSLEHHTGDRTIFSSVPPQFRGGGQGPPPLYSFHQPHERTCDSAAI
ncbi:hypothetical protein TNCV_2624361 [Trichonephila clavipes]|nr:hypothetical protein TNCV_2624361 [Trichonephila clavipes]